MLPFNIEKNIISKYIETLCIKNITNISNNFFLKKPFLNIYIIKLSKYIDYNFVINKIRNYIDDDKINYEDILYIIYSNFELNSEDKKNIQKIYLDEENIHDKYENLNTELILYQIKYFQTYQIISELLFDNNPENNELYNFILVYICFLLKLHSFYRYCFHYF